MAACRALQIDNIFTNAYGTTSSSRFPRPWGLLLCDALCSLSPTSLSLDSLPVELYAATSVSARGGRGPRPTYPRRPPKGKRKRPKGTTRRREYRSVPRRVTPLTLAAGDKDRRFFKLCMFIITYLAYVFCQYIFEAASTRHRRLVLFVVNVVFLLSLVFVQIRHKQAVDSVIEHNHVLKTRQEVTSPDVRAIEEG